jgi:hypothetical protein
LKAELLCYICAREIAKQGKFIFYIDEIAARCKIHSDYNLWEVKISDEMEPILRELTYLDG